MSNSNSTCGYLIVNMWKIYSSLRHQGSEASILAGRLVDHFEGEENLMSKVMETAELAANAIDTQVDWNDYFRVYSTLKNRIAAIVDQLLQNSGNGRLLMIRM